MPQFFWIVREREWKSSGAGSSEAMPDIEAIDVSRFESLRLFVRAASASVATSNTVDFSFPCAGTMRDPTETGRFCTATLTDNSTTGATNGIRFTGPVSGTPKSERAKIDTPGGLLTYKVTFSGASPDTFKGDICAIGYEQ